MYRGYEIDDRLKIRTPNGNLLGYASSIDHAMEMIDNDIDGVNYGR